ncbi:ankyrin repeat domain-containing protein [Paludisphaera sp.]|uniref:ankyrin repeat domain-containing protein n=1 Tax=Paludisphaera sp. TaxID=2017432 RepID=UPI00301BB558
MVDAPEAWPPRENRTRKWSAEQLYKREYRAFRTMAEAREHPDAVAVLDLDADWIEPLATFPARRVEADAAALERLRVDLGAILARVMAADMPSAEGRVRYEAAAVLEEMDDMPRLDGVVLNSELRHLGLESEVEAVFLGVEAAIDPDHRRRVPLLLAWREAVDRGDVDAVRELIDRGVPVGSVLRFGGTALGAAANQGDVAMLRLLLGRGADPNQPDERGRTPMTWAAMHVNRSGRDSEDETLRLLIEAGGRLGFREAVILGDVELARSILDADPTIDVSANSGLSYSYPFLMVATFFGRLEMARFLIDRGADVHATDDDVRYTALGVAALDGRADIAALLLDHGADPSHVDWTDFTPLARASEGGHADVVRLLVERGPRRTLADAIFLNDASLIAELLPTVEKQALDSILSKCSLHLARCDVATLRLLLRAWSAQPDRYLRHEDILGQVAAMGRLDVVQLLLEHGFDPGKPDEDGATPAEHAERAGRAEVAALLRAAAARDREA